MRSEIGAVYGPLVIARDRDHGRGGLDGRRGGEGILAIVLAHPVDRSRLILAKGAAAAVGVADRRFRRPGSGWSRASPWLAAASGSARIAGLAVHLLFFGLAVGALALAVAAATGRRAVAIAAAQRRSPSSASSINGFAPLVDAIEWLKYASPFY